MKKVVLFTGRLSTVEGADILPYIAISLLNEDKKISSSEDTHLRLSIEREHKSAVKNTKSLPLRPSEDRERSFQRGVMYHDVVKLPLWLMILYSFSTLRLSALGGYLHARKNRRG